MGKFADSPYFILKNLCKTVKPDGYVYPSKGRLKTLCRTIIAKGGTGFDVYLKETTYKRMRLIPIAGTPEVNLFRFKVLTTNYRPSDVSMADLADYIELEQNEIYFRKAVPLHEFVNHYEGPTWTQRFVQYDDSTTWTVEHGFNAWRNYRNETVFTVVCTDLAGNTIVPETIVSSDENNLTLTFKDAESGIAMITLTGQQSWDLFVNTNIPYLYFGKMFIYDYEESIVSIEFTGMKDYALSCLPSHTNTDNMDAMLDVMFDRFYQQIYHLIRDVWTLQDPNEANVDYLYYLYHIFNMEPIGLLSETKHREFIGGLPSLLKHKGTYSALFIIWLSLVSGSSNFLNVYERWHEWSLPGDDDVPLPYFQDFLYTSFQLYNSTPPILGAGPAYYGATATITGGAVYTVTTAAAVWYVEHSQNSLYIIARCFDETFTQIIPQKIEITDANNIVVTFPDAIKGHVLLVEADEAFVQAIASNSWTATHSLAEKEVLTEIIDSTGEIIQPEGVTLDNTSQYTVSFNTTIAGAALSEHANQIFTQSTASTTWSFNHYYGIYILPNFFDTSDNLIVPDSVVLSNNLFTATFGIAVDGYVVVRKLDSTRLYPGEYGPLDLRLTPHYRVEIDLSVEPLGTDFIMSEEIITSLMAEWEKMRPVCKYAHYSMVLSPKTNFSQIYVPLYSNEYKAHMNSRCLEEINTPLNDCAIYIREHRSRTWYVNHGLQSMNVIIQCFSLDGENLVPATQKNVNINYSEITFTTPQNGYAFITLEGDVFASVAPSAQWDVIHSTGETYPIVQVNDETYGKLIPSRVYSVDNATYTTVFVHAQEGYAFTGLKDYEHIQTVASATWTINHFLNSSSVQVQVYDASGNILYPKKIQVVTKDYVVVSFDSAITGRVEVRAVGLAGTNMTDLMGRVSYAQVGTGTSGVDWKPVINNSLEAATGTYSVTVTQDTTSWYVRFDVDSPIEMDITEMGLFDNDGKIVFYTYNHPVFKPAEVELIIFYRIEKTIIYDGT